MNGSRIRLSKSVVGQEEKDALCKVIDKGYLGMGEFVQKFENDIQNFLSTDKQVCCVNSGTAALHLAVASIINPGDEILVQSLTFVSCFQAISAAGAIPIPCEVNENILIDLSNAERNISEKTKAILPVHYAGNVGDLDNVYKLAEKYKLRVIEDAAHAFGTTYEGKKVGSFGDIICFSFDGIKNITSGEGGAVVSNDLKVIEFIKNTRLLGIQKDTEKRYMGERSWEFDVINQGYRYHMSNLFAAVGSAQLKKISKFKDMRQSLAKNYNKLLHGIKQIAFLKVNYDNVIPHIYPIRITNGARDELKQFLLNNNIEVGVHYFPNHRLSFFRNSKHQLKRTDFLFEQLLSLPLHPEITFEQQTQIVNLIKDFFR